MVDESALLAAVLADPADDDPRLRYADWLDEQGRCERAELIRVQCAGGNRVRVQELLSRHQREWAPREVFGYAVMAWRHGFVEWVKCSAAVWLSRGDAMLACQPVTQVALTGRVTAAVLEGLTRGWPKVKFLMSGYDFFAAAQAAHPVPWRSGVLVGSAEDGERIMNAPDGKIIRVDNPHIS